MQGRDTLGGRPCRGGNWGRRIILALLAWGPAAATEGGTTQHPPKAPGPPTHVVLHDLRLHDIAKLAEVLAELICRRGSGTHWNAVQCASICHSRDGTRTTWRVLSR
jgi:hypothetical protein